MRGHSGGGLSLGCGFPIVSSTKQKLNTRSSTETEIVGADEFMLAISLTRYFMKAQGYGVKDNIVFQDNKSSILLEKNGKAPSSKRTKHINIRYFFITNRIKKGRSIGGMVPHRGHDWRLRNKATSGGIYSTSLETKSWRPGGRKDRHQCRQHRIKQEQA
jgi:hypothetical protein